MSADASGFSPQKDDYLDSLRVEAGRGERAAQLELALILSKEKEKGRDQYFHTSPNYKEAMHWWLQAALHGDARAQFNLAYLYATGLWAATMEQRKAAIESGNHEAIKWLGIAAGNGHAGAQYALGVLHQIRAYRLMEPGKSAFARKIMTAKGKLELADAVKWLQKAADVGHAGAQYLLGQVYGGPMLEIPDPVACARWLRKAANQGISRAQTDLGDMYVAGHGVPQNLAEAARWYRAAAEQGSEYAQDRLGYMYAVGSGVPQDFSDAAKLFHKAAEQRRWNREDEYYFRDHEKGIHFQRAISTEATAWLCNVAATGYELAKTAIEIMGKEAVRLSLEDSKRWPDQNQIVSPSDFFSIYSLHDVPVVMEAFSGAAEQGDAKARLALGLIEQGFRNKTKAIEWLTEAAQQGSAFASRLLGSIYEEGEIVSRDIDRAEIYYRAAATLGDAVAQYEVARLLIYHFPTGAQFGFPRWGVVAKDSKDSTGRFVSYNVEAADWYLKATTQNHAQATSQLAMLHCLGQGVTEDLRQAVTLFRKAAEQGYANAQYELAELYMNGIGIPKDLDQAKIWYCKAAGQNHKLAQSALPSFDFNGNPLSQNGAQIVDWLCNDN